MDKNLKGVEEYREKALEILEGRGVKTHILEGGTENQLTLARNESVLERIGLKMRVIHEDFSPDISCEFLGRKISSPIMPAPLSGLVKTASKDFFKVVVENSKRMGVIPWIGYPIPDKVEDLGGDFIWIIKPLSDRKKIEEEIERAEKCGAFAVGIDIDSASSVKICYQTLSYSGLSPLSKKELEDLVSITKLPFIAKGVLSEEDYELAVDSGCKAVVVSNHGGRVLDSAISPLELLMNLDKRVDTGVDSGFRTGTDIFKAIALGADFVLVGRPIIYGVAVDEQNGAYSILEILSNELKRTMVLCNTRDLDEIRRSKDRVLVIGAF